MAPDWGDDECTMAVISTLKFCITCDNGQLNLFRYAFSVKHFEIEYRYSVCIYLFHNFV